MAGANPITFIRQSIKDFRTTGALAPSGLFLARAISKFVPTNVTEQFQLLEIGAGTGSVTTELARRMKGRGQLHLYEISPSFCNVLRERVAAEPPFAHMRERIHIHEGDVRDLHDYQRFDGIVSGLPFNNFEPDEVQGFLEHFQKLIKPGGFLVWFEYVAIRELQTPFVSKINRARLKGIAKVTGQFVREHQVDQRIIPINLPPARVRCLRFG